MHSSFLLVCSKIRRLVQTNDQQTGAEPSFPLELLSQGGDWHPASAVSETLRQSPAQVLMFPSFSRVTLMLQLYRPFCLSPPHTLLLIIDKANHILLYSHFIPSILLYSLSFIFFFFFLFTARRRHRWIWRFRRERSHSCDGVANEGERATEIRRIPLTATRTSVATTTWISTLRLI